MKKTYLGLAIHNHQPVGNFPWVIEEVFHRAYLPFLEALEQHPGVRMTLHYTGCLLDWIEEHQPAFIARLAKLVERGQVEVMTGGYYEPILPLIPPSDRLGQIAKLTAWVRQRFRFNPTGLWLAERVWEPDLAGDLQRAGVQWTVLDDTHFKLSGLSDEDLYGYYVTEDLGQTVKVFGNSKQLRYLIPWRPVEETIQFLRSLATEEEARIAVMGDDGEKFGAWPGTYDLCWQRDGGWIRRFFQAIENNRAWLLPITLGEYAARYPALGRTYLPTASYAEMMEWSLPAQAANSLTRVAHEMAEAGREDVLRFLRGGFWRNFLARYPEVNDMHKKMLRAHHKVERAQRFTGGLEQSAQDHLWAGQCNCPYWHGLFGGIYMSDIRTATQRQLLTAESIADAVIHQDEEHWQAYEEEDFDCDGLNELLLEGESTNLYIDLHDGGSIFEWDLRRKSYNLASSMTRRPEGYHSVLTEGRDRQSNGMAVVVKEEGLAGHLAYDWYRRTCLIDHFLHPDTTLETFSRASYGEMGDFVNQSYEATVEATAGGLTVVLTRDGFVWSHGTLHPFQVSKRLYLPRVGDSWRIDYLLANTGAERVEGTFGSEWNINLLGGAGNAQAYYRIPSARLENPRLDSTGENDDVSEVALGNRWLGIEACLRLSRPATLWRFPIETITNSEGGFERTYQASSLLPLWRFAVEPGCDWGVTLTWDFPEPAGD